MGASRSRAMEAATKQHPHFRLKVDLSRFFHDARQYCWIFVDGERVQRVVHIEQHIAKLFDIPRPFHLLLNDTDYLPPTEDARILEKNETILLVRLVRLIHCQAGADRSLSFKRSLADNFLS